ARRGVMSSTLMGTSCLTCFRSTICIPSPTDRLVETPQFCPGGGDFSLTPVTRRRRAQTGCHLRPEKGRSRGRETSPRERRLLQPPTRACPTRALRCRTMAAGGAQNYPALPRNFVRGFRSGEATHRL